MATIVEMINPLTGLPEQVDKLDHTAQEIDDAVGLAPQLSNPNLLDNWYFGNPVNQRGKTSYTGAVYGIDRWILDGASTVTAVLTANGITLTRTGTSWTTMFQKIKNSNDLLGKVVTFSVLTADNRLVSGTLTLPTSLNESAALFAEDNVTRWYLDYYAGASGFDFRIIQNNATVMDAVTIKAAKLELGTTQTLAHQDENGVWQLNEIPDYGEQLARCQRYYRQFNAYTKFIAQYIDGNKVVFALPVSMRTAPGMSGDWKIYTGLTEQTGFTLSAYQTGNIIVVEAVKENHGLTSAWLGVNDIGILNADL